MSRANKLAKVLSGLFMPGSMLKHRYRTHIDLKTSNTYIFVDLYIKYVDSKFQIDKIVSDEDGNKIMTCKPEIVDRNNIEWLLKSLIDEDNSRYSEDNLDLEVIFEFDSNSSVPNPS